MAEVTVVVGESGYRSEITARGHALTADYPAADGSTAGPTPYDLLAASLGTCTAMTLRMYADRRGWPLETVTVHITHSRVYEKDCELCETEDVGVDQFEHVIEMTGPLTPEQREGLLRIANRCPVAQTLTRGVRIGAATAT